MQAALLPQDERARELRFRLGIQAALMMAHVVYAMDGEERTVVRLLAEELPDKEIAEKTGWSPAKVGRIQVRLRRRMGVKTRLGIIRAVYELLAISDPVPVQ